MSIVHYLLVILIRQDVHCPMVIGQSHQTALSKGTKYMHMLSHSKQAKTGYLRVGQHISHIHHPKSVERTG